LLVWNRDQGEHGKAKFTFDDGSVYQGEYLEVTSTLMEFVLGPMGGKYEGKWVGGERNGQVQTWPNGSKYEKYEGQWVGGKKHGHEVQTWPNGDKYDREWVGSVMHVMESMLFCKKTVSYHKTLF